MRFFQIYFYSYYKMKKYGDGNRHRISPPHRSGKNVPSGSCGGLHPFKGYPALRGNQPYHVWDDNPSMLPITATVEVRGIRRPGPVCSKVTQASLVGFFLSPGVLLLCGKAHIIKGT